MANLIPPLKYKFTDQNNKPLAGGKIYSYLAGTSTPAATYTDQSGVSANPNPLILDANGEAFIWIRPGYFKFVVKDKDDVELYSIDKVSASGGGGGSVDGDYQYSGYSARFNEVFTSIGLDDTLQKILKITYTAPGVALTASGSGTLREKGTAVTSTSLLANVTKRSDPIQTVRFYQGVTLLDTQTSGGAIPSGGISSYNWTGSFTDNTTFSVQVDDNGATGGPSTAVSSQSFSFVYPYYEGAGAAGKTGAQIRSDLSTVVINSTASRTTTLTASNGQVFYFAYPNSYGALTSILDVNGFETISGWTSSTKSITGLDATSQTYRVYESNNPVVAGSYQFTFKR